jgi:hypothetical protein
MCSVESQTKSFLVRGRNITKKAHIQGAIFFSSLGNRIKYNRAWINIQNPRSICIWRNEPRANICGKAKNSMEIGGLSCQAVLYNTFPSSKPWAATL